MISFFDWFEFKDSHEFDLQAVKDSDSVAEVDGADAHNKNQGEQEAFIDSLRGRRGLHI